MSGWIDITRPMDESLVTWPGRPRPKRRWEKRISNGHHCNVSFWELSAHSGTHMDAPLHFIEGGKTIDQIPPDVFIGECVVAEASAAPQHVGVKRLLLRTLGAGAPPFGSLMTEEDATALLNRGLVLIGTDRLSVDDSRGESFRLHHLFLGAGCVIVEGLRMPTVETGPYFLTAMPLCWVGVEASPVRAFLQKVSGP